MAVCYDVSGCTAGWEAQHGFGDLLAWSYLISLYISWLLLSCAAGMCCQRDLLKLARRWNGASCAGDPPCSLPHALGPKWLTSTCRLPAVSMVLVLASPD